MICALKEGFRIRSKDLSKLLKKRNGKEESAVSKTYIKQIERYNKMAEKPCSNFHGVAAKIINVYLKCTIVIHRNENMSCEQLKLLDQIHPPVDATLLGSLQHYYSTEEREKTVGQPNILEGVLTNLGLQNRHGLSDGFQKFKKAAWSNYNSETYEACIALFRVAQGTEALWEIERHWVGNQQAGTPTTDSDVPT